MAVIGVVGGDFGGVVLFCGTLLAMLLLRRMTPRRLASIERSIDANQRLIDRQ